MANNKIFFSYSRDNSEFVINLAKELREAGATIWLDQLDIKPGTRWDRSIEKALQESNTLLVILSKSSVESHNVMDEVSYALEESRKVVPVLLEECDIPFRLRRLQYADFTQDHDIGIKTLVNALELETDVAQKLADMTVENEEIKKEIKKEKVEKKPAPKKAATPTPDPISGPLEEPKPVVEPPKPATPKPVQPESKSNSKMLPILLGIAALVIAGIFLIPGLMDDDDGNDEAEKTIVEDTPQIRPEGGNTNEEPAEPEINEEDIAWDLAKEQNEIDGFLFYLNKYPNMNDARKAEFDGAITSLFTKTGFIQYSQSNGSSYFDKTYPQNTPAVPPLKGYLIKAKQSRNVKGGAYGTNGFNQTLGVLEKDEYAIIDGVIRSGSAYWVKIKY